MKKSLLFALLLLGTSCSSTKDDAPAPKRQAASKKNPGAVVSKKEYYQYRGSPHAKFRYDNYKGEVGGAVKSVFTPGNIKFMSRVSDLRQNLLENNLFDTGTDNASGIDCSKIMKRIHRSPMGRCYFDGLERVMVEQDKQLAREVMMGSINQRFGRNVTQDMSNKALKEELMTPNPLEISRRLFNREDGKTREAKVINLLASAWLQAMNHDWFTHGKNSKRRHLNVPGDSKHAHFKDGMKVPETRRETYVERRVDNKGYDYTSRNQVTHWWDASQIYGSDAETIKKVRGIYDSNGNFTGKILPEGKIAVDEKNKRLIYNADNLPVTGFHDNWWLGLELIHTIFHLEHNAIIEDVLKPEIGKSICKKGMNKECGEILFEKARMINSALIAKIHTAEWTPALLDNSTLHLAMRANWYGFKEVAGFELKKLRAKARGWKNFKSVAHLLTGLVGENTIDLYGAPFTLTEEFVAVYRMHPLIPEDITVRTLGNESAAPTKLPIGKTLFRNASQIVKKHNMTDWMLSFGTTHPGGMTLHNYPTFMQNLVAERNTGTGHYDSTRMDMGAVDILRDRERGVPKYNDLRRAMKIPPAENFRELILGPRVKTSLGMNRYRKEYPTPTKQQARDIETLRELYDNDIDKVDLLVGTLAENDRYPGYAFGNTPFYIFALMASRRLMADPFFSDYYTPEHYTAAGINHVQKQTMVDVLVRHFPKLKSQFYGEKKQFVFNAFRPWGEVYKKVEAHIKNN